MRFSDHTSTALGGSTNLYGGRRLELGERLGRGGIGEVFVARVVDGPAGEGELALKRLWNEVARDERVTSLVFEEADRARGLRHPNICTVHDHGRTGETCFVVSELVRGRDLGRLVASLEAQNRRMPIAIAVEIAAQICLGLEHAHGCARGGEIHEGLTPPNVLIGDDGLVRLTDFGHGRAARHLLEGRTRALRSKYPYWAPEQVRKGLVDARSDLFAVASLLFEMLTGVTAFRGTNDFDTLDRVRRARHDRVTRYRPEVPGVVEAVVHRGLALDPADRWPTARDFHDALRRCLEDLPPIVLDAYIGLTCG